MNGRKSKSFVFVVASHLIVGIASADNPIVDGTYDARVRTDSGSYTVPVEVEGGEVTSVHWPNGGNMRIHGADVSDGEASGRNYNGDRVNVEIEDPQYDESENSQETQE